jgi:hypothetical protein
VNELRPRQLQLLISALGSIVILPWGVFLGAMFTFAFRADESLWAWAFDVITFWCQIPAILLSFFRPRFAAYWMLLNAAVSLLIGVGFQISSARAPDAGHLSVAEFLSDLLPLSKLIVAFWAPTIAFALLLLWAIHSEEPSSAAAE